MQLEEIKKKETTTLSDCCEGWNNQNLRLVENSST
jgi:hypothetical protein